MAILGYLEGTQGLLSNVGNIADVATGIINNPGTMVNQQLNRLITIVCNKAMSALYQLLPIDSILNVTVGILNIVEQLESGNTSTLGSMAYNFAMAMMTNLGYGQEFALATKVFNLAQNYMKNGMSGAFGYEDLTTMLRSSLLDLSTKALLVRLNNCAHLGALPNVIGDIGTRISELFANLGKIKNPLNAIMGSITSSGNAAVLDIQTGPEDTGTGAVITKANNAVKSVLSMLSGGDIASSLFNIPSITSSEPYKNAHVMTELINPDNTPGQPVTEGTVEGTMAGIESSKCMGNDQTTISSSIMAKILPSLAPEIMVQFRERLRRIHPKVLDIIMEDDLMMDTSDYCGEWFIRPVPDKSTLRLDDWGKSVDDGGPCALRQSLRLKMNSKTSMFVDDSYWTTNYLMVQCISKEFKSSDGGRTSSLLATSQDYQIKGDALFREEHTGGTLGGILTQLAIFESLGIRAMNVNYLTPIKNGVNPNTNIQPAILNSGIVEYTKTGNVNPRKFYTIDRGGIE